MEKLKNISLFLLMLVILGCEDKGLASFDEDEGLNPEFPEALFEFSFDFTVLKEGSPVGAADSVLAPKPKNPYSFASFDAVSEVKNNDGIRFVESSLIQGFHGGTEDEDGNVIWEDKSKFIIKLNVATSGDAINGEPYEKEILLDFLKEGEYYPTERNKLGAIELMYEKEHLWSGQNEGHTLYVGRDRHGNIGDSGYEVVLEKVEDHEDYTREGVLIKKALKVTIAFEGLIGVSNHPDLSEDLKIDQWSVENGRASFLIDYLQ